MVLATGKNLVRRSPASEASTSSLCTSAPRGQEAPRPLFRSMPGDVLYSVFLSRSFTSRNNKWTVALPARPAAAPLATSVQVLPAGSGGAVCRLQQSNPEAAGEKECRRSCRPCLHSTALYRKQSSQRLLAGRSWRSPCSSSRRSCRPSCAAVCATCLLPTGVIMRWIGGCCLWLALWQRNGGRRQQRLRVSRKVRASLFSARDAGILFSEYQRDAFPTCMAFWA
jgi:hypothetical protein